MLTLTAALLVFGLLVVVHEAGHFLVAKWNKVTVYEFSIGFGPQLAGRKYGGTLYSLRLLPLGGFVRMAGMTENDREVEGSFTLKTVGQRAGITAAGPAMNFLLAALLFIVVFTVLGVPQVNNVAVIGEVVPGRPAELAGLQAGDQILAVDGQRVNTWMELVEQIRGKGTASHPLTFEIARKGSMLTVQVVPEMVNQVPQIGIRPQMYYQRLGVIEGMEMGIKQAVILSWAITAGIVNMFTSGVEPGDLAGPVGITQMIGEAAQGGLANLLYFAGILSINLAIINLLPIPALDGSRLIFLMLEKVRGKPIEPEKEALIHLIGFALLMALVLVITYQDIVRLLSQGS